MLCFLDVDGVLNSTTSIDLTGDFPFVLDTTLVNNYLELITEFKLTTVISSSWRFSQVGLKALRDAGIDTDNICQTRLSSSRGQEILWFLENSDDKEFIILDDTPSYYELFPELKERLIITLPMFGFGKLELAKAKQLVS